MIDLLVKIHAQSQSRNSILKVRTLHTLCRGKDSTKIIHVPHSACRECAETGYEDSASGCLRVPQGCKLGSNTSAEAAREIQGMLLHLRNAHTYN